jgi:hypothetical protein
VNTYLPGAARPGDAAQAGRWVDHYHKIYPDDATRIIDWLAHRVQWPGVKVNHAIVFCGAPKIGKDTLLVPLIDGVGANNFKTIYTSDLTHRNNDFYQSVILLVSETRDIGEQSVRIDKYDLYERLKKVLAVPPYMIRINVKYIREYYIHNCFGMIITTNHRDALYLPPDDRRFYVVVSECPTAEFTPAYWREFYHWYNKEGGIGHVIAYLRARDLANFDHNAPPPQTLGFKSMVNVERGDDHGAMLDAIEALGNPVALTLAQLVAAAPSLV